MDCADCVGRDAADGNCVAGVNRAACIRTLVHRGDRSADDDLITIAGSRECAEDSGDGFETVLADLAGVVQFEVQSRGAMGQVGDVRGAADGINDARRNHCRRCVRCVRHGSSLLPYATVFHYRRWVPQKHGNAGKASRNGNYALRCSAIAFRYGVPPHPFSVFAAAPIPTSFHHAESCNRCQKSSFFAAYSECRDRESRILSFTHVA